MTDTTGYDPAQGGPTIAPTGGTEHGDTESRSTTPGGITTESGHEATPLFSHDESDTFELKLQHAVTEFVDGPRAAVEEADHVLEEVAERFAAAVTQRRSTLRRSWHAEGEPREESSTDTDTEQLRLALRDYRELAERLLHA